MLRDLPVDQTVTTSVLTDLDRGPLLEAVFDLPLVFVVPDLLYERELRPYGGVRLLRRGLQVAELGREGVARALNFRRMRPSLSLADTFAVALATGNRCRSSTRGWTPR